MNNEGLIGLPSNLIVFPEGKKVCNLGLFKEIYGMLVGCCYLEDGFMHAFRIPLEGQSMVPMEAVMDRDERTFFFLPDNNLVDGCLLEKILSVRQEFDVDGQLSDDIEELVKNGITFCDKDEYVFYIDEDEGLYKIWGGLLHFKYEREALDDMGCMAKDMVSLQKYIGKRIKFNGMSRMLTDAAVIRINNVLENSFKNGLWTGENDKGLVWYDGKYVYTDEQETIPMDMNELHSQYEHVRIRVEACSQE